MNIKEKEFEELIQELKSVALQLAPLQRKVIILSMALKELGVDEIYLTPRLRDVIDEMAETT